jgi:restriction system-associated AAA family ATPase
VKLLSANIIETELSGGLLNGLNVPLRAPGVREFAPLCLVGPNGSGKSQFLQSLAEAFQVAYHDLEGVENRAEREIANAQLVFEIEYEISPGLGRPPRKVKITNHRTDGKRAKLPKALIQVHDGGEWRMVNADEAIGLLPASIVAYTSGDNETMSAPFMVSRSAYASAVQKAAFGNASVSPQKPRLTLIDRETHQEVLLAILLISDETTRKAVLEASRVRDLHSLQLVVQLAHSAARGNKRTPPRQIELDGIRFNIGERSKTQLTDELECYLEKLKRCATCWDYEQKPERYTFDFCCDAATRDAFRDFWFTSLDLYEALHKLAMLNDLVIDRRSKQMYADSLRSGKLAARLAEPQEIDKIFQILNVKLWAVNGGAVIDYIGLSDGEHQNAQILGMFAMYNQPNLLFLLDEPESHFNPEWRVQFLTRILDVPSPHHSRLEQDCLLTTHSPFMPSDLDREQVLIFERKEEGPKIEVNRPSRQTFGATFDSIVQSCFKVSPPISNQARERIKELLASNSEQELEQGLTDIGDSVKRAFIADRLRQVQEEGAN